MEHFQSWSREPQQHRGTKHHTPCCAFGLLLFVFPLSHKQLIIISFPPNSLYITEKRNSRCVILIFFLAFKIFSLLSDMNETRDLFIYIYISVFISILFFLYLSVLFFILSDPFFFTFLPPPDSHQIPTVDSIRVYCICAPLYPLYRPAFFFPTRRVEFFL